MKILFTTVVAFVALATVYACPNGQMRCGGKYPGGYSVCNHGKPVDFQCASATHCVQVGNYINCPTFDFSNYSRFMNIQPVVLDRHTIAQAIPWVCQAIQEADSISLDFEFSGLGRLSDGSLRTDSHDIAEGNWNTRSSHLEQRYQAYRNVVQTHSLLSFGLCVFRRCLASDDDNDKGGLKYQVTTIDIRLYRGDTCLVDPRSLHFLTQHGFDLTETFRHGIPYYPAGQSDVLSEGAGVAKRTRRKYNKSAGDSHSPVEKNEVASEISHLRTLMQTLIFPGSGRTPAPLVLHNGWLDLMFLYHSFYAPLPPSLGTFLVDLHDMFPNGIYDTKYLADYVVRVDRSFLLYLYVKQARQYSPGDWSDPITSAQDIGLMFCRQYMNHGMCSLGEECPRSHDVVTYLATQEQNSKPTQPGESIIIEAITPPFLKTERPVQHCPTHPVGTGAHSSGMDAFMTNYIFTTYQNMLSKDKLQSARNQLYVMFKDTSLLITPSQFSTFSPDHARKRQTREK
ncbi:hypothetical protein IWQ62_000288 [Dispira parvispora]|uniref:C3H1-type domain-containing protein n=1 Tax=Dispira parvispora TaxID=1520584 RepID=A0A9W8AYP3_9FUNG|nr:hypothetical protein IWQ62_000288 [Dispira parvispora]